MEESTGGAGGFSGRTSERIPHSPSNPLLLYRVPLFTLSSGVLRLDNVGAHPAVPE